VNVNVSCLPNGLHIGMIPHSNMVCLIHPGSDVDIKLASALGSVYVLNWLPSMKYAGVRLKVVDTRS